MDKETRDKLWKNLKTNQRKQTYVTENKRDHKDKQTRDNPMKNLETKKSFVLKGK